VGKVSVTDARRFVADLLRSWQLDAETVGDAELCTAELVTNAVLHAETAVELAVHRRPAGARVEVRDRSNRKVAALVSTVAPGIASTLSDETMSGRGLLLVAGVSSAWGVDYGEDEKTVWFVVGDDGAGDHAEPSSGAPAARADAALRHVRLLDVPVALSVASGNNIDDLVREFQLLALDQHVARGIAASLIDDVERQLATSATGRNAGRAAAAAAMAEGRARYDLDLRVGLGAAGQLERLNALLDEVADRCRDGVLLSLPPSAEVTAFRRWCAEELRAQLEGAEPTRCPFGG
jgi:anti-sigma regulatory factor (Ser/Thr protein kinase)